MPPPVSLQDFAAEHKILVESQCTFGILQAPKFCFSISTWEPTPVSFTCQRSPQMATIDLTACLSGPTSLVDRFQLSKSLTKDQFHVRTTLRAKTFYSTVPFDRIPGQNMLFATSSTRMHDLKTPLDTVTTASRPAGAAWAGPFALSTRLRNHARQVNSKEQETQHYTTSGNTKSLDVEMNAADSETFWLSRFSCTVNIPNGLIPTFWSTTASRQYSLLLDVSVAGIRMQKKVRLEVPLQIYYDLGPTALSSGEQCRRLRQAAGEGQWCAAGSSEEDRTVCATVEAEAERPPAYV